MNETFWNGHLTRRATGDTMHKGELNSLPYPDRTPDITEAIRAMYVDGYVIFPGVLNTNEVALMRERIDAMGSANDEDYVVPKWCYNKQIGSEFHRNPDYLDYIDRPGIYEVADAILSGPDTGSVKVTFGSSWVTGAGRAMGLHVDFLPVHVPEPVQCSTDFVMPIFMATAHYYLDHMIPELGPTTIVPGSHRAGRAPQDETSWNGIETQAAMVKAGDVVFFRSDLWHGAWKNTHPTRRRYIMQVAYGMGYMQSNYPPMKYNEMYTPEVLGKATLRQRRLLGSGESA